MMKMGKRVQLSHKKDRFGEETSPTEGLINLVDAMLVFSCGLLLALVMFWNVDLKTPSVVQLDQGQDVTAIDEVKDNIEEKAQGGSGYEKMGTVFKDPKTGQLYMLEE